MKKTYTAIRVITKGNFIFRDKLKIDTEKKQLTFWKRNPYVIGHKEISVDFSNIVSCKLATRNELLIFSAIIVETIGGEKIEANGFLLKDLKEVKSALGY